MKKLLFYIMQESGEPVKPIVSLNDSNKFTFTYIVDLNYLYLTR